MHDLTSAGQYGDRLVLLEDGRVSPPTARPTTCSAVELLARVYGARVTCSTGPTVRWSYRGRSGGRFVARTPPRATAERL